jgi:hypothetical protein
MLCPERGLKTATSNPTFAKPLAKAEDKTVFPEESWKSPKIKIDRKPQQPLLGCFPAGTAIFVSICGIMLGLTFSIFSL